MVKTSCWECNDSPIVHRQFPRNNSCHFRHKYPGRPDYVETHVTLNKRMYDLKVMGVRMTPILKLKNSDLSDCIHLRPAASKKLLNVIRKAGCRQQGSSTK